MKTRLIRILWGLLTLVSLWVFVLNLYWLYQYSQGPSATQIRGIAQVGISPAAFFALCFLYVCLIYFSFFVVAQLILLRRAHEWFSMLTATVLLAFGTSNAAPPLRESFDYYLNMPPLIGIPFNLLNFLGWTLISTFAASYPDGKFIPRWILLPAILGFVISAFWTTNAQAFSTVEGIWAALLLLSVSVGYGTVIYAQVWRYRHHYSPVQKQQVKWFVLGIVGVLITVVPNVVLYPIFLDPRTTPRDLVQSELLFLGLGLGLVVLPLSIGFAILRYRLWDIDVLIRKTLTYALVAALLAIVYFGSVVLLQQLFASLTGQRNQVITVLSTLAIAALFVPLRNRIQKVVDRRFYRKKYDAQQVLNEFSKTVRDETDLERLTGRLMQVVDETMQPTSVNVWLKKEG